MRNFTFGMNELGGLGLLGAAAFFGWQCIKLYKTAKRLDMTIDDLANREPVDIQQAIVDKAVERAVDREVHTAVSDTATKIRVQMQADMRKEIRKDVDNAYEELRAEVTKKIAEEVAAIDVDVLKKEVTEQAREKIVKKFDGSLDTLLDGFNHNLRNVTRIYDGISSVMSGNKSNGRELSFRLD